MNASAEQEHHVMEYVQTHASGEDEMYCPTCGRRVLIQWPPDYRKTVLDAGDEFATHSGGTGGLSVGAAEISQGSGLSTSDEARLQDWEHWLGEMNFGGMWAGED